jgi:hypothetical protein
VANTDSKIVFPYQDLTYSVYSGVNLALFYIYIKNSIPAGIVPWVCEVVGGGDGITHDAYRKSVLSIAVKVSTIGPMRLRGRENEKNHVFPDGRFIVPGNG